MGEKLKKKQVNPLTRLDYPDPDVIRVDDTYYMVSTTMHFFPGCEILRSYDLINWEHAAYVYEKLDSTDEQKLTDGKNIYGKGMWAASFRFHNGCFYIAFVANDTHQTYLYKSTSIEGPWEKNLIEGFYHDCSLLFDDDDRVYIAYGNKNVYITELNHDLTGPKPGGIHRLAVSDEGNCMLGYEGTHFYKLNNKYYLFFIHSLRDRWFRTEACFVSDSIEGEFVGGDILADDRNYCGSGVAQGAIIDTPKGEWYSILFQDSGAVGRLPILLPMHWEMKAPAPGYDEVLFPVMGIDGRVPEETITENLRPDYVYSPLIGSDDFRESDTLKCWWQFNHEPNEKLVKLDNSAGTWSVTSDIVCDSPTQAQNMITQRMTYPGCSGEVTLDCNRLNDGDYAGLCALQGLYAMVGVTRKAGKLSVVTLNRVLENLPAPGIHSDVAPTERIFEELHDEIQIPADGKIRLKLRADFENMTDKAALYAESDGKFVLLKDDIDLKFLLDHFCGCRFGLVMYSTVTPGGSASFSDFVYNPDDV